jgi:hypothetical protein
MGTKFSDFMLEIENDARDEGPAAVRELYLLQKYYSQRRRDVLAGGMDKPACFSENKMSATYAFVFNWDLDVIELEGDEKTVGHRQIDGSICKIVQTSDGKLVAISK